MMYPEDLEDDKLLVPVDVSCEGDGFAMTYEELVEKKGAQGAAEGIVRAAEHFMKTKKNFKEDERPIEMSVADWLVQVNMDDDGEGEGEEEEDGEEELEEDPEEEEADGEEPEPVAKKSRKA